MTRIVLFPVLAAVLAAETPARAQDLRFVLPTPDSAIVVERDVPFARTDALQLRMDVYRPRHAAGRLPGLLFFSRGVGPNRATSWTDGWARAAAARGLIAILPDLREGSETRDFQALLDHLRQRGQESGVDADAIAVYAASGNVHLAFPFVEDSARAGIQAAVMYYGTADVSRYRLDLPVLFVRAGLDRPPVNRRIDEMALQAMTQNAPLQLLNHPTGYHGFEALNDDDASRDIIERTIDFVKRTTAPSFQRAIRLGIDEAAASGYVATGQTRAAADAYGRLVAARPDDARLGLAWGEALLADERYEEACRQFARLKGKPLGPRDLGLPAARTCMLDGNSDAAIEWLPSIPSRFLPSSVREEAVFEPLRERADFRALFGSG